MISITGPGNIQAGSWATFTVTLSQASGQTVTVNWLPQDGTAVHPDDWTQGTLLPGYELYTTQDGYEVTGVAGGALEDGYYYGPYSEDTGYTVNAYDYAAYSYEASHLVSGYDYLPYTYDAGYSQDGYDYASYTTTGPVPVDGYYYPAYSIANGSMQAGYTVSGVWQDEPYDDGTGNLIDNLVDVPVTPFFSLGDGIDPSWADYAPDQQFVPDGTYDSGDGYWAPDAAPDNWSQGERRTLLGCESHKYAASQTTHYALAA